MKNTFIIDVIIIGICHYILSICPIIITGLLMLQTVIYMEHETIEYKILGYIVLYLLVLLNIYCFCVLPILYKFLEKKSTSQLIQKLIYNLKHSKKYKILIILFIHTLYCLICNTSSYNFIQKNLMTLVLSIPFGLVGYYLVLFLYWHIKDKKQKKC